MPRPPGFEPYMNLWCFQYSTPGGLKVRFYRTQADYERDKPFFNDPQHGVFITADYGHKIWHNNGTAILANLNDIGVFYRFTGFE